MSSSDEWILQIQYVQKRDAGRYECQINTQPVRSYFVQLRVVGKLIQDNPLLFPYLNQENLLLKFPLTLNNFPIFH